MDNTYIHIYTRSHFGPSGTCAFFSRAAVPAPRGQEASAVRGNTRASTGSQSRTGTRSRQLRRPRPRLKYEAAGAGKTTTAGTRSRQLRRW
jgi:hypothetical protein